MSSKLTYDELEPQENSQRLREALLKTVLRPCCEFGTEIVFQDSLLNNYFSKAILDLKRFSRSRNTNFKRISRWSTRKTIPYTQ